MKCEQFEQRFHEALDAREKPEFDFELTLHAETCESCRMLLAAWDLTDSSMQPSSGHALFLDDATCHDDKLQLDYSSSADRDTAPPKRDVFPEILDASPASQSHWTAGNASASSESNRVSSVDFASQIVAQAMGNGQASPPRNPRPSKIGSSSANAIPNDLRTRNRVNNDCVTLKGKFDSFGEHEANSSRFSPSLIASIAAILMLAILPAAALMLGSLPNDSQLAEATGDSVPSYDESIDQQLGNSPIEPFVAAEADEEMAVPPAMTPGGNLALAVTLFNNFSVDRLPPATDDDPLRVGQISASVAEVIRMLRLTIPDLRFSPITHPEKSGTLGHYFAARAIC